MLPLLVTLAMVSLYNIRSIINTEIGRECDIAVTCLNMLFSGGM